MTRDTRNNLIVATLAVSLVVHLATMLWAKPKVMTHVTEGIARIVHRGPARITKAPTPPEPVAVERLPDETAPKEAPKTDETVAILPAEDAALPPTPAHGTSPEARITDALAQLKPEAVAPKIDARAVETLTLPDTAPKMALETPQLSRPPSIALNATMPSDMATAPVFEAPVFAPVGNIRASAPPARLDKSDEAEKQVFKPIEEIMPEVDERIVEAEKRAVRELINSENTLDFHAIVNISLATFAEGGFTYFKVTIHPKPRLPNVPKDVVILLDASGSIGHDRLASCRKATKEILRTAMNTGDRFNLVAFRDKFSYCFRTWQPCDASSYAASEKWMSRLAAHGRTDVFSTISSVLTLPRDPSRPLIALVVTDGDANAGVSETTEILSKFAALNDGLVSVYMYGVKSSANRELIDVLTHGNRGESFIFDGWRWNAGEGIGVFSERFRDPLVTDLRVIFPTTSRAEAYPALLKNLYRGNTVELVGRKAGSANEISFSLCGIAGSLAYEGFFRLPTKNAPKDATLPAAWRNERAVSAKSQR